MDDGTVGVLSPHRQADRVLAVMRVAVFVVSLSVQFGLCWIPLFYYRHEYRPAWLAPAAFAVFALVTLVSGWWVLRRRRPPGVFVASSIAVLFCASTVATAAVPAGGFFGAPHWSFGLVGWQLLMLLLDRPMIVIVSALGGHILLSVLQFGLAGLPGRIELGAAAITLISVSSFQLAIAVMCRTHYRRALLAGAMAAERERLATEKAVAEQLNDEQRVRFAGQLGSMLPLLVGVADRTLDTRTDDVRRRCAVAAAQLRRLFAENDDVPDPLVHELSACIDVAERRGLGVSLAVSGDARPVPKIVRRELTQPVMTALALARSTARVTVLRTEDAIRVAVVADAARQDVALAPSALIEVECFTLEQRVWVEARWCPRQMTAGPS